MEKSKLGSTKFIISMVGVLGAVISAFAGKFTGELGFTVTSIVVTYVTGNAFITGKSLTNGNGKEHKA